MNKIEIKSVNRRIEKIPLPLILETKIVESSIDIKNIIDKKSMEIFGQIEEIKNSIGHSSKNSKFNLSELIEKATVLGLTKRLSLKAEYINYIVGKYQNYMDLNEELINDNPVQKEKKINKTFIRNNSTDLYPDEKESESEDSSEDEENS